MSCNKVSLNIELIEDGKFDLDDEYIILKQSDWNIIEYWLKICDRSGVLEEEFKSIKDVTTWPLTMRRHA